MGELRASLYDIFGYLLPGLVAIIALRLLTWFIFYPDIALNIKPLSNSIVLSVIGLIAYIMGHFVHSIGNWLPITKSVKLEALSNQVTYSKFNLIGQYLEKFKVSQTTLKLVDDAISRKFGPEYLDMSYDDKFSLIDEFRVLSQKENEREIFTYREGFYRGMVIALFLLLVTVGISLFSNTLFLSSDKILFPIYRGERWLLFLATIIIIIGFWRRMVRFSYYRLSRTITLFLVLSKT